VNDVYIVFIADSLDLKALFVGTFVIGVDG
jgi:hypothetical protein